MYLGKIGFFKEKKAIENYNLKTYLEQLATNIKNNTLKKVLLAYLQQELYFLTLKAVTQKKIVVKKKRLLKLKYSMRKHKARRCAILTQKPQTADLTRKSLLSLSTSQSGLKTGKSTASQEADIAFLCALGSVSPAANNSRPMNRSSMR